MSEHKPNEQEKNRLREYWRRENLLQDSRGYFKYALSLVMEDKLMKEEIVNRRSILDVGCGHGEQLLRFREKGAKVYGIDLSDDVARIARQKKLTVITADARSLPFKQKTFDIVYSLGVLEHFNETEKAIEEQARVLRPGGNIIVVVPYLFTPYAIAITAFEIIRGAAFKYGFTVTRGKLFSKRNISAMLAKVGCDNIKIEACYGSAFLRMIPGVIRNTKFIHWIEKSFLSKKFGLVLYAQATKKIP